jgi:hypothetical protein
MNLTLAVDDEVVERARTVAASQGTSLQALVRKYLEALAGKPAGHELVKRIEEGWRASDEYFARHPPKAFKFNRDEIYAERLDRMMKSKK